MGEVLNSRPEDAAAAAPAQSHPSDAEFRFFYESAPMLMGTVELLPDGDLLHLYDNPASNSFFGLPPGSTQGRRARSLGVPEATLTLWRDRYAEAGRLRGPVTFDYAHSRASGEVTWLSVTVAPLGDGSPSRYAYVATDVTARREAEFARAESEARFRATFEQAAVGIAHVALDGRWIRVNQRLCEILGYSEEELRGVTFQAITHPDDLDLDLANAERLLAGEAPTYRMEKRYIRTDGRIVWAELTVSLARDGEGRPAHFISVVQDITTRREAEAALRVADERLSLATAASGLGIWERDFVADRAYYSPRAKEIFGFRPDEEVTYETVLSIIHPDDRAGVLEQARAARDPDSLGAGVFEYRIIRRDGQVRWVRALGQIVFEPGRAGAQAARFLGTLEDITERRQIQEKLRESESRLRLAMGAGRMAVFEWPLESEDVPLTDEIRALLGVPPGVASTVQQRRANYHPEDSGLASSTRERALSGRERFIDFEFRYFWPDGQMRWLQVRSEVMRSAAGTAERLVGVLMDVTERKRDEERLRLLTQEVDHRANNLLTVVQGLVSLSTGGSDPALREVLIGRITALAHAHKLLSEARWTGADLRRLVEEELRPYGLDQPGRVGIRGPACSLSPQQAQAMGLALHELATNAGKYGGLSVATGSVSVSWTRGRRGLELLWAERGGPPVSRPTRLGLGTRILERALGGPIGGEVSLDWKPEGLNCRLRMPLAVSPTPDAP